MKTILNLLVVITGLNGFAAEILLLREFLIIFSGNEFSIGIILANWLLLESVGCYIVGKTADKNKKVVETFVLLTIIFCLFFPVVVYLIRVLKPFLGVSIGESLTVAHIFLSSFFLFIPVSVSHGALFTYSCKLYSILNKVEIPSISKVYILETVGTILGSIVTSYLFIPYINTFNTVFILTTLNILFCIFFLVTYKGQLLYGKFAGVSCTLSFLLSVGGLFLFSDKLHWDSVKKLWKAQNVVDYQNSKYNNICVTEYEGQYTFFVNGKPAIITPIPDIMFVEEYVHIPLLSHRNPECVLVISGGAGGVINEIIKHPTIKIVDYVELDPSLIRLIQKYSTELTQKELTDERVKIRHLDGRWFVRISEKKYDVIFIGLSDPQDIQTNRFFTKEFFKLAKTKLNPGGSVVLTVTGSLTYLSDELVAINSCIYYTLSEVFSYVRVLPGDGKNIFIASDDVENISFSKEMIITRILDRRLKTEIILPRHIEYKLHPRWQEWFFRYVENSTKQINSDLKPQAVFYSLAYWNKLFAPYINKFLYFMRDKLIEIIVLVVILWLSFIILFKNKLKNITAAVCVGSSGFTGMVLSLVFIASFQSVYGYVFSWIGILTGFFMLGTTLGAMLTTSLVQKYKTDVSLLKLVEILFLVFCIVSSLFLIYLKPYFELPLLYESLKYIFLILSLASGVIIGGEFPIATSLQIKFSKDIAKTTGLLYSFDLLGGWIAGVFAGLVLLPIVGMIGSCIVVTIVKLMSLLTLASTRL